MAFTERGSTGYDQHSLGSLTLSATNETLRAIQPSGFNTALVQGNFITEHFSSVSDVQWIPVGIIFVVTTTITVTQPVVQLWKNGAPISASANASITIGLLTAGANEVQLNFGNYLPISTPPGVGDVFSLKVTTAATAGVINPVYLVYAKRTGMGLTDGVLQ